MIKVAIVGGGVSGCYSAYRLASRARSQNQVSGEIQLFEMSNRVGGRLLSKQPKHNQSQPMEFGGMYISNRHQNVFNLATRLGFEPEEIDYHGRDQFLRAHALSDYSVPWKVPYFVDGAESGRHPIELLIDTLMNEFPKLPKLWPLNAQSTPRATAEYLRSCRWRDQYLYEVGFWNLLSELVSNEAYEMMLAASPTAATLRNGNAYDTIWTILNELLQPQDLYQLKEGYQKLAERLMEEAQASGAHLNSGWDVSRIDRVGAHLRLSFASGQKPVEAEKVILALPRGALERIAFGDDVFGRPILDSFRSVIQVSACKLFLAFESPWWLDTCAPPAETKGQPKTKLAIASTDLPMRQCFFFGEPSAGQPALMLATYADDVAASFWKGFRVPGERTRFNSKTLACDADIFCAPPAMIAAALRQLRAMYPGAQIGNPIEAAYFDWSDDPYGAAWHAWKAHVRSWDVGKSMRHPNPPVPVFICGEAFASLQGWVEGAINVAEVMLEESFALERPDWVSKCYEFQIE